MKKLMCLFVSMLTLTMTSCGDDVEDTIPDPVEYSYISCNGNNVIPSDGGSTDFYWSQGVTISDKIYTAQWKYKPYPFPEPIVTTENPWEKLEVRFENGSIVGEWFVITPSESLGNGRYSGIDVVLSQNTTGKRRCLKVFFSDNIESAYVYQECPELE